MILPFLTTVCGCVFLLLSMLETRTTHLPIWKDGVLPTLAHALDTDGRDRLRLAVTNGEMKKLVGEEIVVKLEAVEDGFEQKAQNAALNTFELKKRKRGEGRSEEL
jgi:hypothetical protein